jgi:hypothetical protein
VFENVQTVDLPYFTTLYEGSKMAYKRIIEPLPDKSQWQTVDLPYAVAAPLDKRGKGRYKKLRIKSCLEGGNSKGKKVATEISVLSKILVS